MSKVKILPEEITAKIAAGEVIERPHSVVKELVENALDACATMISVSVRNGGKSLIRVVDNGEGMDRQDAENALLRYATSKIGSLEDMTSVKSLGFRGEALPSIAAVSRFAIITRYAGNSLGTEIRGEGGRIEAIRDCERPLGTTVEVRDLFFNLPVRRKFLKSERIEYAGIVDVVNRLSIAYPKTAFRLYRDGTLALEYPSCSGLKDRVAQTCPPDWRDALIPLSIEDGEWQVNGFIGKPEITRNTRSGQFFFVNQRPVKILSFSFALQHSFDGTLPQGRYPVAFLFLQIDPAQVDVNVHPHKREVRILKEGTIQGHMINGIKEALRKEGSPPEIRLSGPGAREVTADTPVQLPLGQVIFQERIERAGLVHSTVYHVSGRDTGAGVAEAEPESFWKPNGQSAKEASSALEKLRLGRVYGQLRGSYILMEAEDGLMVIDQHAAHERVVYEEILHSLNNGFSPSQALLIPLLVHLDGRESAVLEEYLPLLGKMGFGINELGNNSFSIDARPPFLRVEEISETLRDFAQSVSEGNAKGPIAENNEKVASLIACKSRSVKANEELTCEEIQELIQRLVRAKQPFTCPHGRPTVIKLTTRELEAKFLRT
jgi:DNA mismatch repair protein MutL